MTDGDDPLDSESGHVVERGETYDHAEYGRVEVTGIWQGVHRVDTAHHTEESGVIIVRYATEHGKAEELTDTIDGFLAAIEPGAD